MCNRRDYPPYPDADPASQVRADLERPDADAPVLAGEYAGWTNRATWSAYQWLSGDLMLFRVARARVRSIQSEQLGEEIERFRIGGLAVELVRDYGGPIARREIELAGGFDQIARREIADALVDLFDGDDRS